ncbi:E3 ubiquitin-protein ligase CCNP1IP1 [Coccidioides immitis RS]|uniref:E3 ubiquitin-protein ligase CCNP1IP1 n=4 Tax=Coccidioides immitis TaxID=5501 RepID=A0A0D8JTZ4_COCIM|nr:E3 ubiquitin-protein ligase CCNP1IP1 [Coccidioides immitis RS]KJF60436.1 E3 ubiquitin-protein ligase CCNP1IP1 [Coccidioides immitis RS]KMP02742.1 hypothetical protein CIRG_02434 [Coccidioides immitis RMSCC 2394]KMU81349.1 hypothetical protein CISG_08994 [Coccidioides immitis RMSCC 3703]
MAQALDICLRCNSLQCRSSLTERAIVTTCSHIFCLKCADRLDLARSTGTDRQCPACQTSLLNPDDVVSTVLNPTDDYKTSVLSGLDPNTIMECAGRALAFWAYQTAQEIFFQEYLGKNLTDKYTALNRQMDKVVHDANSEITSLHQRIADLKSSQQQLQKKNQELVELYRDKSKRHAQITNLYNILKSRTMRSQLQTAVSDTVAHTLQSLGTSGNQTSNGFEPLMPVSSSQRLAQCNNDSSTIFNSNTIEHFHRQQRSESSNSQINSTMMPPPTGILPSFRESNHPQAVVQQSHRTQIPPPSRSMNSAEGRVHQGQRKFISPARPFSLLHRSPNNSDPNRTLHTSPNNYGLSAGVKIGRPNDSNFTTAEVRREAFSRPVL